MHDEIYASSGPRPVAESSLGRPLAEKIDTRTWELLLPPLSEIRSLARKRARDLSFCARGRKRGEKLPRCINSYFAMLP